MGPKQQARDMLDGLDALELPPFETLDVASQRSMFDARNPDAPEPPPIHESSDRTIPGHGGDLTIRILRPSGADDLPVIVYFHGGGWVICSVDSHDGLARALANAASAVVVNVEYRLAPEHPYPAAIDDAIAAIAWVSDNAAELGVDAARLAVAGDSAGGNLAAACALWARDSGQVDLSAQALIYPVTNPSELDTPSMRRNADGYLLTRNWMAWLVDQYLPGDDHRRVPFASPALAPSHVGVAPAFVLTAEYDPLLDDGRTYAEVLREAGVDVVYREFEGQIHGFASGVGVMEDASTAIDDIAAFLSSNW